jgi:sulfoxide reductase heme-binding subunit YedZ
VGVLHYWWLVKIDTRRPRNYAVMLAVLLGARLFWFVRARAARRFGAQST